MDSTAQQEQRQTSVQSQEHVKILEILFAKRRFWYVVLIFEMLNVLIVRKLEKSPVY